MSWIATPVKTVTWPCSTRPPKQPRHLWVVPGDITQDVVRLYDRLILSRPEARRRQRLRREAATPAPAPAKSPLHNAFAVKK